MTASLLTRTTAAPRPVPINADLEVTYPKGRRCPDPGCITVLCQLNAGPYCFLHTEQRAAELSALSAEAA